MSQSQFSNKQWLQDQLFLYSIRDIAKQHQVSPASVRYWIRKHQLPKSTISEGMLKKSEHISEYSKNYWKQNDHRHAHSTKMIKVQASRKEELSQSAKKNWKNNRDAITAGIKISTTPTKKLKISNSLKISWTPARKAEQSEHSFSMWENDDYRSKHVRSTESFITSAQETHGDKFIYDKCEYVHSSQKITIKCACGHEFQQLPHNHLKGSRCPKCNVSTGQREIYDFIVSISNSTVHLNDRRAISPHEIDIYIPDHKLGIEYHGLYWHSYNHPESKSERLRHQQKCDMANFTLFQIFDHEWSLRRHIIESIIKNKLGMSHKIAARKTEAAWVDKSTSAQFFDDNHLYGNRPAKFTIGLYHDDYLVMAISLSHHRDGLEIIRMASTKDTMVQGGVSKLIAEVKRRLAPSKIITFADKRYSDGRGYLNSGFKLIKTTKPGYFYYKGNTQLSRQQCQKHKLHKLLPEFDESLTESENMFNHGYRRVWDAGHLKLVCYCGK